MGRKKTGRRKSREFWRAKRWNDVLSYLKIQPSEEHRRFFARAVKHLLRARHWDSRFLADPSLSSPNFLSMVAAFNSQNMNRMRLPTDVEAQLELRVITPINLGNKARSKQGQISRFTVEMMQIIRMHFPASSGEKHRVTSMPDFATKLKKDFYP